MPLSPLAKLGKKLVDPYYELSVYVPKLARGSFAEKAGLLEGDIRGEIAGQPDCAKYKREAVRFGLVSHCAATLEALMAAASQDQQLDSHLRCVRTFCEQLEYVIGSSSDYYAYSDAKNRKGKLTEFQQRLLLVGADEALFATLARSSRWLSISLPEGPPSGSNRRKRNKNEHEQSWDAALCVLHRLCLEDNFRDLSVALHSSTPADVFDQEKRIRHAVRAAADFAGVELELDANGFSSEQKSASGPSLLTGLLGKEKGEEAAPSLLSDAGRGDDDDGGAAPLAGASCICGRELRAGASFCDGCGATVPLAAKPNACAQCSRELRGDARFCDACGAPTPIATVAHPAEPAVEGGYAAQPSAGAVPGPDSNSSNEPATAPTEPAHEADALVQQRFSDAGATSFGPIIYCSLGELPEAPPKTKPIDFGVLMIRHLHGVQLPAMDRNGLSDPYLVFEYADQRVQTHTRKKTLNPIWGSDVITLYRVARGQGHYVNLSVYDKDTLSKDDFIAQVAIPLDSLPFDQTVVVDDQKIGLRQTRSARVRLQIPLPTRSGNVHEAAGVICGEFTFIDPLEGRQLPGGP